MNTDFAVIDGGRRGSRTTKRVKSDVGFETMPHLVDAERLFRRFIDQVEVGDHAFGDLRLWFADWCDEAGIAAISDTALGRWLRLAGLGKCRSGKRRVTVYRKFAAKQAARFAA